MVRVLPRVLDGAAGTYLESLGVPLHPTLWSSGSLLTPEGRDLLRQMHRAYIEAGADIITSTTYQASIPALVDAGLSESESKDLITLGITLAKQEAAKFNTLTREVQVAGGLGPYGAYLSHGEEYTGEYGDVTYEQLQAFWLPRVEAVLAGEPDILLFETVPSFLELQVIYKDLAPLAVAANVPVWVSLSLRIPDPDDVSKDHVTDDITLADGTPLTKIKEIIPRPPHNWLIGANCFDVRRVEDVLEALHPLGMPIVVYPNSGEVYDGNTKTWTDRHSAGRSNVMDLPKLAARGAVVIGGCCRTTPQTIQKTKERLEKGFFDI